MPMTIPVSAGLVHRELRVYTPYQFGAKGDGTTDDTAAFLALKAAVEATVTTSSLVEGRFNAKVDLLSGKYVISGSADIFPSAGAPRPWGLVVTGVSEDATQILYAPSGVEPCLYRALAGGACRSKFQNFSVICTNNHATAAGFITTADGTGGPQSDTFENIAFKDMPHGIIDDGTNLNSERTFQKLTFSGGNTLIGIWLRGLPTAQTGGDQFVNQWFYDCSFTCSYGTLVACRYGGSLLFNGGNWIHTNQNAGTACGSPVYVSGQCSTGTMPNLRVPSGSYAVVSGMQMCWAQNGQQQATNASVTLLSGSNTAAPVATVASTELSNQSVGHVAPVIQVASAPTSGQRVISLKSSAGGTSHTLKRGDMLKVSGSDETTHWVATDATLDVTGVSVDITPPIGTFLAAANTAVECVAAAYIVLQNSSHAASTAHATFTGVRAEHRTRDSRLIDSEWSTGTILFNNLADSVNSFNVGPFVTSAFRFSNDGGSSVRFTGGHIHGGHAFYFAINGWQTRNAITYDGVTFTHTPEPGLNLWTYAGDGFNRTTHGNPGGVPAIFLNNCRGNSATSQHVATFWHIGRGRHHRQHDALPVRHYMNGVYGSPGSSQSVTIILDRNKVITRTFGWMPASTGVTGTSPTWTLTNGNAVQIAQAAPATSAAGFVLDVATPYEAGTDLATRTLTLTANAAVTGQTDRWRWFLEG